VTHFFNRSESSKAGIKRLLALAEGKKLTDIRARAIEVKLLRLDDFDWKGELLSVSCSKTRKKRIFPLSRPVGDAVLLYIKARPCTRHREVFLTLYGRPRKDIYMIVSPRLRRLQADIPHHGPHALRHACTACYKPPNVLTGRCAWSREHCI
jgi:integrase/recombinase XerD